MLTTLTVPVHDAARGAPDAHALAHVGRVAAAIARARSAPSARTASRASSSGRSSSVALAHGREHRDDRLRDRRLQIAVAAGVRELGFDRGGRGAADGREDVDQVGDAGLVGRAADLARRSR